MQNKNVRCVTTSTGDNIDFLLGFEDYLKYFFSETEISKCTESAVYKQNALTLVMYIYKYNSMSTKNTIYFALIQNITQYTSFI